MHSLDRRTAEVRSALGEQAYSVVQRFLPVMRERAEPLRELVGAFDFPHHHSITRDDYESTVISSERARSNLDLGAVWVPAPKRHVVLAWPVVLKTVDRDRGGGQGAVNA